MCGLSARWLSVAVGKIIKGGKYNPCPGWIHRFLYCTMIRVICFRGSSIQIRINRKNLSKICELIHRAHVAIVT